MVFYTLEEFDGLNSRFIWIELEWALHGCVKSQQESVQLTLTCYQSNNMDAFKMHCTTEQICFLLVLYCIIVIVLYTIQMYELQVNLHLQVYELTIV